MSMPGFSAEVSLYDRSGQYEHLDTQTDRAGRKAVTPAVMGLIVNGEDFRPDSDTPAPIWQHDPFTGSSPHIDPHIYDTVCLCMPYCAEYGPFGCRRWGADCSNCPQGE